MIGADGTMKERKAAADLALAGYKEGKPPYRAAIMAALSVSFERGPLAHFGN